MSNRNHPSFMPSGRPQLPPQKAELTPRETPRERMKRVLSTGDQIRELHRGRGRRRKP